MRKIIIIIIFACFSACNSENKKAPNKSSAYKNYIAQIRAIDAIGELDDSSNSMYFENPKLKLIFLKYILLLESSNSPIASIALI